MNSNPIPHARSDYGIPHLPTMVLPPLPPPPIVDILCTKGWDYVVAERRTTLVIRQAQTTP